uniref:NADH-ubiquinone oxidoreductase chain 2 n=1 Tax=Shinisaurus crocodilurus TaxID=52224 RepID=E1AW44_SHICO|nr:NADH dehydrogenase subunit 2 [Shinisaurus crocodilurus]
MNPYILTLLMSSTATGTIITMTSYHWILAWVGLELNTLSITPIIAKMHHPRATEAATKYFLTQAAASALILFSSSINAQYAGLWDITQLTDPQAKILLTLALSMKLGLVPLHFWLPEVLQGTSFPVMLIIITWQKLAPITILYLTFNQISSITLLTMSTLSIILGGLWGLNQTQLRKILAFSSIAHLGWMTAVLTMSPNLALFNLTLYITITLALLSQLTFSSAKTIQDTGTMWTTSPMLMPTTMLTLLSLGGLPPLTGFLPKWLILKELITQNMTPLATTLALATLTSLFFYLRLAYTTSMTLNPNTTAVENKWRFKTKSNTMFLTMTSPLALLMTPITPFIIP